MYQHTQIKQRGRGVKVCGVLEKMKIEWMVMEDGTKCMPFIYAKWPQDIYRVNKCPSCGADVRSATM